MQHNPGQVSRILTLVGISIGTISAVVLACYFRLSNVGKRKMERFDEWKDRHRRALDLMIDQGASVVITVQVRQVLTRSTRHKALPPTPPY
jgi:hypothetical protein